MIDKQCKGLGKIALHWSMNRHLFNTYKWQIFNSSFITNFCRTRINRKQVKRRHGLILTALQTMWVLLWKKYWYLNVQIIYHCELYQLNISSVASFNIFVGGKNIFSHRLIDRLFVLLEKYPELDVLHLKAYGSWKPRLHIVHYLLIHGSCFLRSLPQPPHPTAKT